MRVEQENLVATFLELVKINGTSGEERAVTDYLTEFCTRRKLDFTLDPLPVSSFSNTGNFTVKTGNGGNLIFLAHMDTARPTAGIKPQKNGNRISSDGSTILGADNRAGMAILLHVLENMLQNESVPDITMVFTVCEETSMAGSRNLALPDNLEMGFVVDSSYRPGNFVTATFGALHFEIEVLGKASHAALAPDQGINSIMAASQALAKLHSGRINDDLVVNFATVTGGTATNVVPVKTRITGEIRARYQNLAEEHWKLIESTFNSTIESFGTRVNCSFEWTFKPFTIDHTEKVYQVVESAIISEGLTPNPLLIPGGSDANSLNLRGVPSINLGIGAQNPHSTDEFILIDDLVNSARIVSRIIKDNAKKN